MNHYKYLNDLGYFIFEDNGSKTLVVDIKGQYFKSFYRCFFGVNNHKVHYLFINFKPDGRWMVDKVVDKSDGEVKNYLFFKPEVIWELKGIYLIRVQNNERTNYVKELERIIDEHEKEHPCTITILPTVKQQPKSVFLSYVK